MLTDITIVVIDSLNYNATTIAINETKKIFPEAKVLVFSDKDFYPCDKYVSVPKFDGKEHSRICLEEVPKYVETEWAVYIQYDGFPTQAHLWNDKFLEYDYIGAVMWDRDGLPVVGNGGFSLRSKKLMDLLPQLKQDVTGEHWDWLEDQLISVKYRSWLESQGVTYAPPELANLWSKDHPLGPPNTFGFHSHNLIPEYCGKEITLEWIKGIDESIFWNKNLYCIPYYLWKWDELVRLREFMLTAERINPGWSGSCWKECNWRITTEYPDVDPWQLQQMIFVYGYTGP